MSSPDQDGLRLSKYQKNDIYRQLEASGTPVNSFELDKVIGLFPVTLRPQEYLFIRIFHPATGSLFGLAETQAGSPVVPVKQERKQERRQARYVIRRRVGGGKSGKDQFDWKFSLPYPMYPWHMVVERVGKWALEVADYVKRLEDYDATPDLWEKLKQGRKFLSKQPEENLENTPFTPDEEATIPTLLRQIRDYIAAAHELTSEQISRVESTLKHAEEASKTMGRKDWITLFNGAIFSLILTDTITPGTAKHVILMAVSHLFGIAGPPLHLPPG